MAFPMPRVPPVTSAVFPLREKSDKTDVDIFACLQQGQLQGDSLRPKARIALLATTIKEQGSIV